MLGDPIYMQLFSDTCETFYSMAHDRCATVFTLPASKGKNVQNICDFKLHTHSL